MRKAGLLVWHALQIAKGLIRPGVTTAKINARIEQFYENQGVIPVFKGVPGVVPFPAANCICVNEELVHGIPGPRVLLEGDIVSVDTGCKVLDPGSRMRGWCGDSAFTFSVGTISEEAQNLLNVTQQALQIAIDELPHAKVWSDVARKMEKHVNDNRFSVVESLVGHGIGREMHEEPQVPNYVGQHFVRSNDFKIKPGLVIAVEPMVNAGTKRIRELSDHWTIVTDDLRLCAHFEHTLAVTSKGVRILTGPPESEDEKVDLTPYLSL